MTRILVDLDDTVFDWSARYDAGLDKYDPERTIPRSAAHSSFNLFAGRTTREQDTIATVMNEPGFYRGLKLIPGAKDAIEEMLDHGIELFFVTSPLTGNLNCASDKIANVRRELGLWFSKRIVITDDKTIIHGDILIDDKGEITGAQKPSWTQVLIDRPHNQDVTHLTRLTNWANWPAAIKEALA